MTTFGTMRIPRSITPGDKPFPPIGVAGAAGGAARAGRVWPDDQSRVAEGAVQRHVAVAQAAVLWWLLGQVRGTAGKDHVPFEARAGGDGCCTDWRGDQIETALYAPASVECWRL